jgi:hypothetical protein
MHGSSFRLISRVKGRLRDRRAQGVTPGVFDEPSSPRGSFPNCDTTHCRARMIASLLGLCSPFRVASTQSALVAVATGSVLASFAVPRLHMEPSWANMAIASLVGTWVAQAAAWITSACLLRWEGWLVNPRSPFVKVGTISICSEVHKAQGVRYMTCICGFCCSSATRTDTHIPLCISLGYVRFASPIASHGAFS